MMGIWWNRQLYREGTDGEGGEGGGGGGGGGEESGFKGATADSLADLYTDESDLGNGGVSHPVEPPAAAPAQPTAPPPVAAPAAPAAPTQPAAPPQPVAPAVQPSAPTAPVSVEQPPVTPAAAAPTEPPPEAPAKPTEPEETEVQWTERLSSERVKLVENLERLYVIPEADVDSYRESPETYLPKLAAKLHVEVLTAVANGIYTQLPNLINGVMAQQRQQVSYEDKFFQRWSKLNTPELKPKVLEMVQRYRQFNPTAPFETLMEEVGAMAHVRYRIPYEESQSAAPASAPAVQPAAPARPFVPGGTGGAAKPAPPADTNPFTQLANEFLADGSGW